MCPIEVSNWIVKSDFLKVDWKLTNSESEIRFGSIAESFSSRNNTFLFECVFLFVKYYVLQCFYQFYRLTYF